MPKTIIHITETLGVGGTEILLANSLPSLTEYNHIVIYLGGDSALKEEFKEYPVHCLEHTGKQTFLRSILRLRKLLKKYNADIIHAHLLWSSFIARLAKPKGIRLITSIHSVLSKDAFEKNRLSLWMEKLTTNRQDDVIGVSKFVIEDYLKFVPYKKRTHLLYNFVPGIFFDTQTTNKVNFSSEKPILCIAVGNLKDVKNYDYILDAFQLLPKNKFILHIAGEGPLRKRLESKITEYQLPVKLLGSQHSMQKILPQYYLFIQASSHEGFGIALAEGIGSGLIPVLSDIPVHREVTDNKAWYFDLNNPGTLATILVSIAEKGPGQEKLLQVQNHIKAISSSISYFEKLRNIYSL